MQQRRPKEYTVYTALVILLPVMLSDFADVSDTPTEEVTGYDVDFIAVAVPVILSSFSDVRRTTTDDETADAVVERSSTSNLQSRQVRSKSVI